MTRLLPQSDRQRVVFVSLALFVAALLFSLGELQQFVSYQRRFGWSGIGELTASFLGFANWFNSAVLVIAALLLSTSADSNSITERRLRGFVMALSIYVFAISAYSTLYFIYELVRHLVFSWSMMQLLSPVEGVLFGYGAIALLRKPKRALANPDTQSGSTD